jgi:hypothetical protein
VVSNARSCTCIKILGSGTRAWKPQPDWLAAWHALLIHARRHMASLLQVWSLSCGRTSSDLSSRSRNRYWSVTGSIDSWGSEACSTIWAMVKSHVPSSSHPTDSIGRLLLAHHVRKLRYVVSTNRPGHNYLTIVAWAPDWWNLGVHTHTGVRRCGR